VGGQKDGHPLLARQLDQQAPKVITGGRVDAGGRLIEDQHFGAMQHGNRQRQTLAQAQRQFSGLLCGHSAEVETFDQLFDTRLAFSLGQVEELRVQHQVLSHAQLAVQRETLRHKTNPFAGGQVFGIHRVAEQFGAALGGWYQPGQDFHGGGFATAVGTQKAENLTSANGKTDLVHRGKVTELKRQVVGFNGDIAVVAGARRDHQRFIAVAAVALVMGKGLVEFSGAGGRRQFLT